MTDMPVFGILCCGGSIGALGESVRCCETITAIMKNGGYALGGYHTALTRREANECAGEFTGKSAARVCGEKLAHLCRACDVVFTVGADGFAPDDIIPDVTMKLCESEAVFFTCNLCGLWHIGNYDRRGGTSERAAFPPSKSRAGILNGCLVLNIRSDRDFISAVLPGLLPSITFAAEGLCGRDAKESRDVNAALENVCEAALLQGGKASIAEKIQRIETEY